ncbi:MAG TPA: hypothetical protein PK228_16100 [Saprospiraceae bacterium]|nr:hypothetical protein [Saprospiraceae bacterium]
MKKSFFNLSVILISALSFTACKKEKTFEEKIAGEWHSVSVKLNGTDVTNFFSLDLDLQTDKDFKATLKTTDIFSGKTTTTNPSGEWTADDGKEIELTYDGTDESESYDVIEFADEELTVETLQDGDKIEIIFERQ